MRFKILCIEDDPTIQALVEGSLDGFQTVFAPTLKDAERELTSGQFNAILIDIQLPDGDGIRFLSRLAEDPRHKRVPALVLTGQTDITNKLAAFSLGADDFIAKPFDPRELKARVSAKVRKSLEEAEVHRIKRIGDLEIDLDRQKAFRLANGKEVDLNLTAIELRILLLLSRRLEQVFSREQILSEVWGETQITDRTIDSHIAHLRAKIEPTRLVIETVKNLGYRSNLKPT